ncbi:hypothetical protein Tco_0744102 [Tanacetum coccineum]
MDTAYRISWIRRIGPIGYGVSDLLGMAYRTYWVRRIGSLGMAYWHFGYGVLYILGMAYRASWVRRVGHYVGNCTVKPMKKDVAYLQTQLQIAQKEEVGIQLNSKEFYFMATAGAYDEIEEVNANCTLKDYLQQASTSGTQIDIALVYDSVRSAEPHAVQQNNSNVISVESSVEQSGGTVEQHLATVEETPQQKQQILYNGKALLEKHDPPTMYDSEETLQLAQESRLKMKHLNKEIKPINYAKINQLLEVFVSLKAKLREELYFLNTSETASVSKSVSKSISIPNEKFSDDTSPSVALKFLNEFLKEAAEVVRDFKSLTKDSDESLARNKALEYEIERLLRAVVTYNDMQNQIERLQAQLGDLKGKSMDTQCASNILDPLSQKLDDENVDTAQTKTITDSLQDKLHDTIYENAMLRAQLFDKVFEQNDTSKGTSGNTKFTNQSILGKPSLQPLSNYLVIRQPNAFKSDRPKFSKTRVPFKVVETIDLLNLVTSNSVPKTQESKVVNNMKVITPGMFRINPTMNSRVDNFVPNKHVKASVRTKLITVSQPHVITKKDVNSNINDLPSTGVESNAKTRRPQPRSNPKNDRIPSASKSSCYSNNLEKVEEHYRKLLFSKTPNHRSSAGNNIKLAIRNEKSEVICATCKKCVITANHDECVFKYVNGVNSSKKNQSANVSERANQKKHKTNVKKLKKLGSEERLASPRPSKPRTCFRWLPT